MKDAVIRREQERGHKKKKGKRPALSGGKKRGKRSKKMVGTPEGRKSKRVKCSAKHKRQRTDHERKKVGILTGT